MTKSITATSVLLSKWAGQRRGEREILKRIHENEEKLRTALDEQGKAILDAIKDDCLSVASTMGERRFHEAFSLGAKLMVELLTDKS